MTAHTNKLLQETAFGPLRRPADSRNSDDLKITDAMKILESATYRELAATFTQWVLVVLWVLEEAIALRRRQSISRHVQILQKYIFMFLVLRVVSRS
jgi:hypothetical protein